MPNQTALIAVPLVALLSYLGLTALGLAYLPAVTASITALTVGYWVTEALPIPATSLIPFAALPLAGVLDHKVAAQALGSHVILLLMAAFMLSKALEKSLVHQRLAVNLLGAIGAHSGRRLLFGFMITAALLSMWISNTATALIMMPMAMAISGAANNRNLTVALILGIAYASSVGGMGTLIGTPPNVIFAGIYEAQTGREVGFLDWMAIGIPVVIVAIPLMAVWLGRNITSGEVFNLPASGAWRAEERRVLVVFAITVVAWVTRSQPFGGWTGPAGIPTIGDSTIALAAVVVMFIVPAGRGSERLLDWESAVAIPWGMLLLFAGGICLASGFDASGLSDRLGDGLRGLSHLPTWLMLLTLCLAVTYLTEITSNTATATLLMPILAAAAVAIGLDPKALMIPAALAASSAFMLPVATAPNAIAYGTGQFTISEMAREGALLSATVSSVIALVCYWLLV